MSDKKSSDLKSVVNRFASAPKPARTVKSSSGNSVEYKEFEKLMRGSTGLAQHEAGKLLYGSVDNWKKEDPDGTTTRNKIRKQWNLSLDPKTEIQVSHNGGDNGQTYFIISKTEYNAFYDYWAGFGPSIDSRKKTRNDYTMEEIGQV